MLQEKDIEILRKLFSQHNYIMTTAELTAAKLYYADIKLMEYAKVLRVQKRVRDLIGVWL